MQKLSVAAIVVAALGLILALVAFLGRPEGAEGVRGELKEVSGNLDELERRIDRFRGELKQVSAARSEVPAEVQELSGKVDELGTRMAKLDKALAALAERPAGAAGATAQVDQAKIEEAVAKVIRARIERMRAGRGAQPGGQQPGQQRGPPRVEVANVPQAAKDAAAKAVKGFKIDHVHPAGKVDGKDTFNIDGNAEGNRGYRIRVTADGKVLESAPRSRRGRGRRPTQRTRDGGNRPQPGATKEPEPF
jgi:prefoldin subunit 5